MRTVLVTEIIRRSEQGVTRPFLCRTANGESWFVKGVVGAGCDGLRGEWIGAKLASALRLPVPHFSVAEVSESLISLSAVEGVTELGRRFAFASHAVSGAQEIVFTQALALPLALRARILLFDWWLCHEDRILTPLGGNPNILLAPGEHSGPWLIDHHNAFDLDFSAARFWKNHIFSEARRIWTVSWRRKETARLRRVVARLKKIWESMPEAWLLDGDRGSDVSALEYERVLGILRRPIDAPNEFWNIP